MFCHNILIVHACSNIHSVKCQLIFELEPIDAVAKVNLLPCDDELQLLFNCTEPQWPQPLPLSQEFLLSFVL